MCFDVPVMKHVTFEVSWHVNFDIRSTAKLSGFKCTCIDL